MITIITVSVFSVFLAFMGKYKKFKFLFEVAFIIIFLFTALRFNFGRDYLNYYDLFMSISKYQSIKDINFDNFKVERGWVILNFLFKPIGFFGLIFVLSAFISFTYYSLIKKYVSPNYYWFAIFIFAFSTDIMWMQFSAIRQALSITIFIYSVKYITKTNKPLLFVLFNLFGSLFHTSALFMVPLVIFSFNKLRNNKILGALIMASFWLLLLLGEKYFSRLSMLTAIISGDSYTNLFDIERDTSVTFIGGVAWSLILFIVIYYLRKQDDKIKNFFYLSSFHSMIYVVTPLIQLADRMGYYFAPFTIITFPFILQSEKKRIIKVAIMFIYIAFLLNRLIDFSGLEWVIAGFSEYKTILSK